MVRLLEKFRHKTVGLLIFWYSQDANVTPPVCLAAYSAAGISGSKPLETGLQSWKLAKGIYIIPLLFVYTPILFNGPTWQVVETAVTALAGLFCLAAVFERFHIVLLGPLYRAGYLAAAILLLWPALVAHGMGAAMLLFMIVMQKAQKAKEVVAEAA